MLPEAIRHLRTAVLRGNKVTVDTSERLHFGSQR
jgi:hypothetical protein